jgi:hypothetical protein
MTGATRSTLGWPVIGALALVLILVPPVARASSFVFIKPDGNVWLAGADGHDQLQVTGDGSAANPYYSPSQTASGSIEVARGVGAAGRIYRLNRGGLQLSSPFPVTQAPAIVNPVVSSNGRRVAFWTISLSDVPTPCYTNLFCFEVSYPNRFNQLTRPAWMTFAHPAWMGSSRLLLFNGGGTVYYADLSGHGSKAWFSWPEFHNVATEGLGEWLEGAASSSGRELALLTHLDGRRRFVIQLFSGPADASVADLSAYRPAPLHCQIAAPDGSSGSEPGQSDVPAFSSLSFSPGGSALAYEFKGSTYVASIATCAARKLIRGGSEPFWGPTNVVPPYLNVGISPNASVHGLLRGLRVTVRMGNPGRVTLSLVQGRHTLIARSRVTLTARRLRTLILKPWPRIARRLAGSKQLRATLTATLAGFRRPIRVVRLTLPR